MAADGQAGGISASGWIEDIQWESSEPRKCMACLHIQDGRAEASTNG